MVNFATVITLLGSASLIVAGDSNDKPKARSSKKPKDINWSLVTYDPNTADTVEDAAWNCIVDFAEIEPRWACDFTNAIAQDYANMCTPNGDIELMRRLVYPFCAMKQKFKPQKRPYLKKSSGAAPSVMKIDVDVNILGKKMKDDRTATVEGSGQPIIIDIDANDLVVPATRNWITTTQARLASSSLNTQAGVPPMTAAPARQAPTMTSTRKGSETIAMENAGSADEKDAGPSTITITMTMSIEPKFKTVLITASSKVSQELPDQEYLESGNPHGDDCFEDSCLNDVEGCDEAWGEGGCRK